MLQEIERILVKKCGGSCYCNIKDMQHSGHGGSSTYIPE